MSIIGYISLLFIAMSVSSCMAMEDVWNDDFDYPVEEQPYHYVMGKVMDVEDNAIEHIKVTVDWGGVYEPSINYTASDGSFSAVIPVEPEAEMIEFKITLEDIDGEENGGLFKTVTDKVIYSLGPESPSGFMIYRLNRATASENTPQS